MNFETNHNEFESLTPTEMKALGLLRCKAITGEWVAAECGTCGGPCQWPDASIAQIVVPGNGTTRTLAPMCDRCMWLDNESGLDRMRRSVNDKRIQRATEPLVGIDDRQLATIFSRWIVSDRRALLLVGPSGYGKTTQIKALIKSYVHSQSQPVSYFTEAGAYQALTRFETKEEVAKARQRMQTSGLLVIDDFGTATGSEYRDELLFEIVDHVYRTGRRIILATNLTEDALWAVTQDRVRRRIEDMAVRAVTAEMVWRDVERRNRPPRAMDM